MIFPKEFISQIKDRILTSSVVSKRVALKHKGKEYSGLCPFHMEKTPSFTVNDDKGFYHCFGCGAHGNVFDFFMQTEGVSFPEAVEMLASEIGLAMPRADKQTAEKYDHLAKLMNCAEAAAKYFQDNLRTSLGSEAREYVNKRGLSAEVVEQFRLGFAPDIAGRMQQELQKQGFTPDMMQEIGLVKNNYEMFRGRLIFPITDSKGRVIAFGGRILSSGEPKYLNSPETPIFHKRRVLFGRAIAKKPSYDSGRLVVTEGYMDAISLNQAGYKYAVAPLGTSLSEEHLQEMWQMVKEPVMCMDGDNAGKRAMERTALLALPFLKPGYSLKFLELPAGQDPDDYVRANQAGFELLIQNARPLSEVIYNVERNRQQVQTPEQQADLRKRLEDLAAKIADKNISKNYGDYFRQRLWEDSRKIGGQKPVIERRSAQIAQFAGISAQNQRLGQIEWALLGIILSSPALLSDTNIEEEFVKLEFSHLEIDNIRQNILVSSASCTDNERLENEFRELEKSLDAKFAPFIRRGTDYVKKSATARAAWENLLEQYHLVMAETEIKTAGYSEIDDFEKLQEKFNRFEENRKKINAATGD